MNAEISFVPWPPCVSSGESRQLQYEQTLAQPNPDFLQFTMIVKFACDDFIPFPFGGRASWASLASQAASEDAKDGFAPKHKAAA